MPLEDPSTRRRQEFLHAVTRSRKLHGRWVSPPATKAQFDRYLDRVQQPNNAGYWVLTDRREIAGVVTISEIVSGNFRSGYLGYYGFVPHNGLGYMTAGVRSVVSLAFRRLRLHRLEANIQPANTASRRLLERLGFRYEGFSPR